MVNLVKKINIFVFLLFVCSFFGLANLQADTMRSASLTVQQINDTDFSVVWRVPSQGNNKHLALKLVLPEDVTLTSAKTGSYFKGSFIESFKASRPLGLKGFTVKVEGPGLTSADVITRFVDVNGDVVTTVLNSSNKEFTLQGDEKKDRLALSYIILGFEHILIGLDHLLFITCLIYISRTRKKLLFTITGFTVAHSVTLIGSALGFINFAGPPVEASIALSILFLALEIYKNKSNSLTLRYPVLVSSSFGLLHGFGFASVLGDIGLPSEEKVLALLYFNVGVEFGQIFFVAILFGLYLLATFMFKKLTADKIRLFVAYSVGTLALFWLLQRLSMF